MKKTKLNWRRIMYILIKNWKYNAGDDVLASTLADEVIAIVEECLSQSFQAGEQKYHDFVYKKIHEIVVFGKKNHGKSTFVDLMDLEDFIKPKLSQ